jgi:hypothetical protein
MGVAEQAKKLGEALSAAGAWSWPIKFILGAALSAVAGGGVLSFLVEHAMYAYAMSYGVRPPVEGVPYLAALVSFTSVAMLLLGAAMAVLIVVLVQQIQRRFAPGEPLVRRLEQLKGWKAAAFVLVAAAILTAIEIALSRYAAKSTGICVWPLFACRTERDGDAAWSLVTFAFALPLAVMIWRRSWVWWCTGAFVSIYYAWLGLMVLPPEGYARLLRNTGFGGGIAVTLDLKDSSRPTGSRQLETHLVLRSASHIVVYNPESGRISEYPMSDVQQVAYAHGGLSDLPTKLPPRAQALSR